MNHRNPHFCKVLLYAVLVVGMVTRLKLKRSAVVITKNMDVAEYRTPCKCKFNVNVIMVMCGRRIAYNGSRLCEAVDFEKQMFN